MPGLAEIRQPVKVEMEEFEKRFASSMNSKVALLNIITNYILRRKGKQIRPLFVFLTAKMLGETTSSTYIAASLIELLHTATLVHDDVVDESYERRGFFSINAIWKSKIAVLIGDYLLARGLLLSVNNDAFDLLAIVSNAMQEMSEGELIQIQKSKSLNIDIETYYEVIRKKTATLIASCTAIGAKSINSDDDTVKEMYDLGIQIGMAFQIKDDLFDYQPGGIIGKPTGNDIKEKKFTLPLIYALHQAPSKERKRIIHLVKSQSYRSNAVHDVVAFAEKYGGLTFAEIKMREYQSNATSILNRYPESAARNSLMDLISFTVNRTK
jgi:octaprenyl-diphosphate synthase